MASEQRITSKIPKIYRRNYLDLTMFGWMRAARIMFPGESLPKLFDMYRKDFGIEVEEWDWETANVTYSRMLREFFETK